MNLRNSFHKCFRAILFIVRLPRLLSDKLRDGLESWSEMAPYRIRLMTESFSSMSGTGLSSLKKTGEKSPDFSNHPDMLVRKEMLIWRFVDYDRMMFGRWDPITARQWMVLADFYNENRGPAEARQYYELALKVIRKTCKSDDRRYIEIAKKAAQCNLTLAQSAAAQALLEEIAAAQETRKDKMDERIPVLLDLARAFREQGKNAECVKVLNQLVFIHEEAGLPISDECLRLYKEIAGVYRELGDAENERLFANTGNQVEFMQIVEKAVGDDAGTLVREMEPLIPLYRRRGQQQIVETLIARVQLCKLADKVKHGDYKGVERDLEELAAMYEKRNKGADRTVAFHHRARAKRIKDKLHKLLILLAVAGMDLAFELAELAGIEIFIAQMFTLMY